MHELSIAQNILDIVKETLSKENNIELKEVNVEIGEIVAVVPDSLKFCYNTLIEDTEYEESILNIKVIPLTGMCKDCGEESEIDKFIFICKKCNSTNVEILKGQELKVINLKVD